MLRGNALASRALTLVITRSVLAMSRRDTRVLASSRLVAVPSPLGMA